MSNDALASSALTAPNASCGGVATFDIGPSTLTFTGSREDARRLAEACARVVHRGGCAEERNIFGSAYLYVVVDTLPPLLGWGGVVLGGTRDVFVALHDGIDSMLCSNESRVEVAAKINGCERVVVEVRGFDEMTAGEPGLGRRELIAGFSWEAPLASPIEAVDDRTWLVDAVPAPTPSAYSSAVVQLLRYGRNITFTAALEQVSPTIWRVTAAGTEAVKVPPDLVLGGSELDISLPLPIGVWRARMVQRKRWFSDRVRNQHFLSMDFELIEKKCGSDPLPDSNREAVAEPPMAVMTTRIQAMAGLDVKLAEQAEEVRILREQCNREGLPWSHADTAEQLRAALVAKSDAWATAARDTRMRVGRNFAAAAEAALSTLPGQRMLAEHHLREDARRYPAFAAARRAVVMAWAESFVVSGHFCEGVTDLLTQLRGYEDLRGAGREPSAAALHCARTTFGEERMAIYERYRTSQRAQSTETTFLGAMADRWGLP